MGLLLCDGYDYEKIPDEFMEALLSEPFFTRKMKMLSGPDDFMLYGIIGVDLFFTFELLNPNLKKRYDKIKATSKFYMFSDNTNVSLGNHDCSLYTRSIALTDAYRNK